MFELSRVQYKVLAASENWIKRKDAMEAGSYHYNGNSTHRCSAQTLQTLEIHGLIQFDPFADKIRRTERGAMAMKMQAEKV